MDSFRRSALDARRLPRHVRAVVAVLEGAGHQAYVVGGAVRDLLLGGTPKDYDIATDAHPQAVRRLFARTVDAGERFGAVKVLSEAGDEVDVVTFRRDLGYSDGRRPDSVLFSTAVEDDLARRDFTINALAWDPGTGAIIDPFDGRGDLAEGVIRAVGDPDERFREDALRTLRAVRLAVELGFDIDEATWRAIEREAAGVRRLSAERIRDELVRILASDCGRALWILYELGLLYETLPEMRGAERLPQAKPGAPTLLDHLIQTAAACPPDPALRLAGLLHDLGKLTTRTVGPDGRVRFPRHEKVGGAIARTIAQRLRFPARAVERIGSLVEMHMALRDVSGAKTIRRWFGRYGEAWVRDLIALGRADAVASGWPEDEPLFEELEALVAAVAAAWVARSVKELAIDGRDVMERLGIGPGPRVGRVLQGLFDRVLEEPALNTRERLLALVSEVDPGEGSGEGV